MVSEESQGSKKNIPWVIKVKEESGVDVGVLEGDVEMESPSSLPVKKSSEREAQAVLITPKAPPKKTFTQAAMPSETSKKRPLTSTNKKATKKA